jgi:hypothetical protein
MQVSAQGSILWSGHFRASLAVDGTPSRLAKWTEFGLRFGQEASLEVFVGAGAVPVSSQADWMSITTYHGCDSSQNSFEDNSSACPSPTDTQSIHNSDDEQKLFTKFGFHLARRAGGPWCELQVVGATVLPDSPLSGVSWNATLTTLEAGWSQPTPLGTATLALRETTGGKGTWVPSVALQWTGELHLGG